MAGKGAVHSNLFVGNLNADATDEQLKTVFTAYGVVESCRVVSKDERTNGFVKMADVDAAERAIAGANGQNGLIVKMANFDVGGKQKIYGMSNSWAKGGYGMPEYGKGGYASWAGGGANYGKGGWGYGKGGWDGGGGGAMWSPAPKLLPREDEPDRPEGPPSENLYVKHWPVGITEEDVKATFAKAGEVVECRLLRPDFSLEWAALVRMATEEQAKVARETMDNVFPTVAPRPLSVKLQTKNGSPKEDHCYVQNVPTNTTKDQISALFSKYGEVKWCDVMAPRGSYKVEASSTALVEMASPEEAQKAIAALNDSFEDLGATIRVRYALNKDRADAAPKTEEASAA